MTALDPGTLFANRFEVDRRAGTGGMGDVYRARDRYTRSWVALKLLNEGGASPQASARFAREARLLSELTHPGIVAHVAHGQAPDGRLFLAMEWLEGEDLGQRLARGPLSVADCVALLQGVAEALGVAHRRGVVHRDLKPTNLFLVEREMARVKVLDFGIARRIEASRSLTRAGVLVGTPNYMAPEQACGDDTGSASDIFSLGCVLYECLTGEPPFVAEHPAAVLARILFQDPMPVEARRPGIPEPLTALLRRMLEKRPDQRFADADALLAALAGLGELSKLDEEQPIELTAPSASFAEREQGLFSLVVASPRRPRPDDDTVTLDGTLTDAQRRSAARSALGAMGTQAHFIADGSLVVKVLGTGSATDQAAHAARAALVVKELWPMADVALATGRGALDGPLAVGEVTDRAIRLLTQSEPSAAETHAGVWVDQLSARLLGPRFALTASPDGALLTGTEKDADAARPLLGKPTPCVGREAELGSLEAQIAGCIEASEARAVLVTAPPGAGKSRLRHELLRRVETRGEPVTRFAGRGNAVSAGTPYGILAVAIRGLAGVGGSEPIEEQRRLLQERVGQRVAHMAPAERERVICFVGEMCGIPFPDEGMPMLQTARQEPKIMGDCLRRAALDWLAAECAAGPVLVVLDDLHWGDALTVSVMNDALREQAGAPLFVLALARPEVHEAFPRLWHDHKMQEIALRGLSRKACERLIREVLGKDVPATAVDRAIDQSAGNALFLEELIRSIAEGKAEDQPETVLAMLQARIGRLPAGPRRALRAASVFGQTFRSDGVAALLGLHGASAEVLDWLSALAEAELIQPSRLHGEKGYGFRHALMRDAAYGLLTASDLATGHRLAGEFLEATGRDGEHDAAVVAEHFERGGAPVRAAAFYLRAAEESLPRTDYAGARRLCERGLGCAPEGEVLGRLKSVVCYAGFYLNAYDEGTSEAALTATTLLRPGSLGWCRAMLAAAFAASHDPTRMFDLLSLLGGTEPDLDARVAHIEAESYVCSLMATASEPVMQAYLDRLASSVEVASKNIPAIRRYLLVARGFITLTRYPRPWSALTDMGNALRLAQEVGDQKTELVVKMSVTEIGWLELGDLDGARRRMLALEERLSQSQEALLFAAWVIYLGRILCEAPEPEAWEKAEELTLRALSNTGGALLSQLGPRGALARVALVRGQLEKAEELARAAMEMRAVSPWSWLLNAPVHVRALIGLGRATEACVVAEQVASAIQSFGGAGFCEVEARLAVAEAFAASGDPRRARVELRETLRQVKLRADDVTDPFWRESYLTKNPHCVRVLALGRAWGVDAGDPA